MAESSKGARVRVNVSTTSKGVPLWDATVEMWDSERDATSLMMDVLERSDALHSLLKARYGSEQGG